MSANMADGFETVAVKVSPPPLIVDLGKLRPKKVKQLKKGLGPYLEEVVPAVEQVRAELGKEIDNKEILTVVVVYEKKRKKAKLPTLF